MFDISWGELLLIGVVALVVIGPKELPTVLRTLGQWMAKLRRMATEFQNQFHEAMREAEVADLKKQVEDMTSQAQSYANFDPIGDVRRELESTQHQIEQSMTATPSASSAGSTNPAPAASATPVIAPPEAHALAPPSPPANEPAIAEGGPDSSGKSDAGSKPA
jgi:sec-independent protein translocase protein TatB